MKDNSITPKDVKNNFIVTQSNSLIEANYSPELTARAHKIAKLVLSLIQPDDGFNRTYTIRLDAVKQYLGMGVNTRWGDFYDRMKETAEKLNAAPIEIKEPNGSILVAYFLSSYKLEPNKGTITFEISGLLKPYLLELKKNYTSYLLLHIPKLRSVYSIRLYELLHQYRTFGKRSFNLDDLQRKVGSNYKLYGDFKRKVLLQAQKDLKKNTDLAFVFDEQKEGRRVVRLEFIIFGNKPEKNEPNQLSFLDEALSGENENEKPALSEIIIEAMNSIAISEQNIAKYLALGFDIIEGDKKKKQDIEKRCGTLENYYLEKLELTKQSNSSSNGNNAAGFFIKALKEDWINSKALKQAKQKEAAKRQLAARKKLEALEKKIEKLTKLKDRKKAPIIKTLITDETIFQNAYDATFAEMGSFMKSHYKEILQLPIKEQYEKGITISIGIHAYLVETYPERFEEVKDLMQQIEKEQENIVLLKKEFSFL